MLSSNLTRGKSACRLILTMAVLVVLAAAPALSAGAITGVGIANKADRVVITVQGGCALRFVPIASAAGKYVCFQFQHQLAVKGRAVPIRSGGIYSVRYSNFRASPPTSRIVVNTTRYLGYATHWSADRRRLEIHVMKAGVKPPGVPLAERNHSLKSEPKEVLTLAEGKTSNEPAQVDVSSEEPSAKDVASVEPEKVAQSLEERRAAYRAIAAKSRLPRESTAVSVTESKPSVAEVSASVPPDESKLAAEPTQVDPPAGPVKVSVPVKPDKTAQSLEERRAAYRAIAAKSRIPRVSTNGQAVEPPILASTTSPLASLPVAVADAEPRVRVKGITETTATTNVSGRVVEPPTERLSASSSRTASLVASRTETPRRERKVSVNFLAADINDVLKALSVQSGYNIVASKDVTGQVTVSLSNVGLEEALDYVAKLSGYTYTKENDTYLVSTKESLRTLTSGSGPDSKTEIVKINYAKADDVITLLKNRFPDVSVSKVGVEATAKGAAESQDGQTQVGLKNNLLVLAGPEASVKEARALAEQFEATLRAQTIESTRSVYRVKFASPAQLAQTIKALVPGVDVVFAPTSDFELVRFKSAKATSGQAPQVERDFDNSRKSGAPGSKEQGQAAQGSGASGGSSGPVTSSRTLVIVGDEKSVTKAMELAAQLDVKSPQIKIDAKITSVQNVGGKQLGVLWRWDSVSFSEGETEKTASSESNRASSSEAKTGSSEGGTSTTDQSSTTNQGGISTSQNNSATASTTTSATNTVANSLTDILSSATKAILGSGKFFRQPWNFSAVLEAMVTSGQAQVLASPSIVCLERNPGVFFVGDEVTYIQRIEVTPTGQNIITDTKRVGVQMVVVGEINDDGYITLYLHPEVSTLKLSVEQGVTLPVVSSRFTDHVVRVKNGETIVIGGLIRNDEIEEMRKVPILGDLPLLGHLFRHKSKSKDHTEVVMFITASILQD